MSPTSQQLGTLAEDIVARYLVEQGAEIVARNLRIGMLELDIVARIDALILVVEVRYRSERSYTTAFSSIDPKKQMRIRRAGQRLWDRRYRSDPTAERMRFDVAAVSQLESTPLVEYVAGAF